MEAFDKKRYKAMFLFGGLGGGAIGMQRAEAEFRGVKGSFEVLGSVDVDKLACQDFEALTGVTATCMDLFDREQYRAWHGKDAPPDWHEAQPDDIRTAAQNQDPDVVVITAPCKGFSGLLPSEKSKSDRYQALNRLTYRGIFLTLLAWEHNLPGLILFENVPRITTRGAKFLKDIKGLLGAYGYVFHEGGHDCGELGGLGQHRKRYLLIARLPAKVTSFVYKPPKRRVRSIGEVLQTICDSEGSELMPGDPAAGPMHQLPRLQWKTWMRLALIPPGGDWRDLQDIDAGRYRIGHTPMGGGRGAYLVQDSAEPSGTITSDPSHRKSGGASTIADPRLSHLQRDGSYQVGDSDCPAGPIVGSASVTTSNSIGAVADHRGLAAFNNSHRVADISEPSPAIIAQGSPSCGAGVIADPRLSQHGQNYAGSPGLMGVTSWDATSGTLTGSASVSGSNSPAAVADPRYPRTLLAEPSVPSVEKFSNMLRMTAYDEAAMSVTGATGPYQSAGLVADPRPNWTARNGTMHVTDSADTSPAVLSAGDVQTGGASSVADHRVSVDDGPQNVDAPGIPADDERGVWVIVSPHRDKRCRRCWHRPLTTLELAALQNLPTRMPDGSPLVLAGKSDRAWRERIGNAVPPATFHAIGEQILMALLPSETGDWVLSPTGTPIWVEQPEAGTAAD